MRGYISTIFPDVPKLFTKQSLSTSVLNALLSSQKIRYVRQLRCYDISTHLPHNLLNFFNLLCRHLKDKIAHIFSIAKCIDWVEVSALLLFVLVVRLLIIGFQMEVYQYLNSSCKPILSDSQYFCRYTFINCMSYIIPC